MEQPSSHPPKPSAIAAVSAAPVVYPPPVGSGAPQKAAINLAPGSRPLNSDVASKVCHKALPVFMYDVISRGIDICVCMIFFA